MDPPAFGHPMREEFRMNPDLIQLNQGSYGTVPKRVVQKLREIEDVHDSDFNAWFRNNASVEIPAEKAKVAGFLGMEPQDFAFVENATRGINNVLKRLPWSAGDVILINNWTYGSVVETVHDITVANEGVSQVTMQHPYPLDIEQQILDQYEQTLQQNPNIKIAVVDHISSAPAILFPVAAITELCHRYNVQVLIDGAHCPGHIDLNIAAIGADYYVGTLYKWAFSSRGAAIQWVRPDHHARVFPAVTSFDVTQAFPDNHFSQGTRNEAPYLTASAALEFYQWIGGFPAIQGYCAPMLDAAVGRMAVAFGTEPLQIPPSMEAPLLRQVLIPDLPGFDMSDTVTILNYIRDVYGIWAPAVHLYGYDVTTLRVSGSIFNEASDYDRLLDAIVEMMGGQVDEDALKEAKRKSAVNSHD